MANNYRRYLTASLAYAELAEIAVQFNQFGIRCDLTWDEFQSPAGTEVHWFLDMDYPCSVGTQRNLHHFETGQDKLFDPIVDQILLNLLKAKPIGEAQCHCSHCYSHWSDNSDLEGAWQPQPSMSCEFTEEHVRNNKHKKAV